MNPHKRMKLVEWFGEGKVKEMEDGLADLKSVLEEAGVSSKEMSTAEPKTDPPKTEPKDEGSSDPPPDDGQDVGGQLVEGLKEIATQIKSQGDQMAEVIKSVAAIVEDVEALKESDKKSVEDKANELNAARITVERLGHRASQDGNNIVAEGDEAHEAKEPTMIAPEFVQSLKAK